MIKLGQRETKSLVVLHGWSAIFLGFLLYAVVATGTVAVLEEEIHHWTLGKIKPGNPLTGDVDKIIQILSPQVDPEFLEEIGVGHSPHGHLQLFFHTHRKKDNGQIEDYGVQYEVDIDSGEVLTERTGTARDIFQSEQSRALSRFLVETHVQLHLPNPWGLLLTGILGLAMLLAAVSGFLMHRHLFKDIFVLRRDRKNITVKRDLHTVAGTWSLPFAFILAFTGSFFSFAGSFGIPAMAMVAFGGDQEALIRTVIGVPETESDEKIATVNINTILADANARAGQYPEFASITHYGRGDAKILLFIPAAETKLEPIQYEYNGTSGDFIRQKPQIGIEPSIGSNVFSLIGPLHFGNFGGLLSKAVWVGLGFASCYVILTGFSLWIARRKEEKIWQTFERFTTIFGIGLPVAMLAAGVGYFFAISLSLKPTSMVPWSFSVVSVLLILSGFVVKNARIIKLSLLAMNAILCFSLPVLRLLTGGPFWFSAIENQNGIVMMMDLLLLTLGVFCIHQFINTARSYTNAVCENYISSDNASSERTA